MNAQSLYIGAFALYGLSSIITNWPSPRSLSNDSLLEGTKRGGLIGRILLVMAALSLTAAIFVHVFPGVFNPTSQILAKSVQ
jgi:hypothetical protein